MIDWERHDQKDGTFWSARVATLTEQVVEELFVKAGTDESQRRGGLLELHWCDGYVEFAVVPRARDPWGSSYQMDIDEFWVAADIEDLDEMDRELSALRESGTALVLDAVRRHLPWVETVNRYEDTVFSEPDEVYELN
ncbi:MAG: hypothetical protein H6716_17120 [Polyangiaceae bacterium]|nr:hypothetical protein [Polyangiaceae bacterium]